MTCLGYLRDQLEKVAARELPECRTVGCGRATLELPQPTFDGYLELLTEIAPYAGTDTRVVNTLLQCFDGIAANARDERRAAHVRAVREQIRLGALDEARLPRDRDRLAGPPPGVA